MSRRSASSQPEAGYILLAVIFLMMLLLIALAVAAPRIATSIRRDREEELVHRGEQYKHAIKLFYKKMGRYPASIDQLENTNNIHFLRKRYVDPMTGKDDWKMIHMGEAHVKPMGLFSQPIQNGGLSATGGSSAIGGAPSAPGLSSGSTFSSPTSSSPSGTDGSSTGIGSTSSFGGTSTSSTSSFGNGQTMGGAPIVGVAIKDTKASLKEYKLQKHYNEWEFVYDPVEDLMSSVSLAGGGNAGLNGNSGNSNTFSNPGTSPTSPVSSPSSPSPQQ